MPDFSIASATTGMSISTSLRVGSSRALHCANETTATSFTVRPSASDVRPVRVVVGVGLAGGPEVLDALEGGLALLGRRPHRLDPHAHVDVLGLGLLDEVHHPDVGAVEEDRRRHVGDLHLLVVERHVDDAERGDGSLLADLDRLLPQRHAVRRARAAGRAVDLVAHGAPLAEDLALLDAAQEHRLRVSGDVPVAQLDRRVDLLDDLFGPAGGRGSLRHYCSSGTNASTSWISPTRSARQRGWTRMPVRMRDSSPASTTCRSAVSAPSRPMSANANGWSSGCWSRGRLTQAHVVTSPFGPTSTRSSTESSSPVSGSYSVGGQTTWPSLARMPRNLPSRRAVMNRPMIGPTEREYGYSRMLGASRTSGSAIGQIRTRSREGSQPGVGSRDYDAAARSPRDVRLHGPGRGPGPGPQARARARGEAPHRPDRPHRRGARRPRRAGAAGGRRRRTCRPARAAAEPAGGRRDGGAARSARRAARAQRD